MVSSERMCFVSEDFRWSEWATEEKKPLPSLSRFFIYLCAMHEYLRQKEGGNIIVLEVKETIILKNKLCERRCLGNQIWLRNHSDI